MGNISTKTLLATLKIEMHSVNFGKKILFSGQPFSIFNVVEPFSGQKPFPFLKSILDIASAYMLFVFPLRGLINA
jgi:hypothetical protein